MTRALATILFLAVFGIANAAPSDHKKVFFAGGQSNATQPWADAIQRTLEKAYGDEVILVHAYHPGNWLKNWYTNTPRENYRADFFNVDGSATLQRKLRELADANVPYEFVGFFWFQGEGDSKSAEAITSYEERFTGMLEQLKTDLKLPSFPVAIMLIDGNDKLEFDDPAKLAGRTREDITRMREALKKLAIHLSGTAVDSRGYKRRDLWHLLPEEASRLGSTAATEFLKITLSNKSKQDATQ